MRRNKVLNVVLVLFCILPCFANKSIVFNGHWNADIKSLNPQLPIQAWLEDNNKDLLLKFSRNIGMIYVTVTNSMGEKVYGQSVDIKSTSSVVISVEKFEQGDLLSITDGNNMVYGYIFNN